MHFIWGQVWGNVFITSNRVILMQMVQEQALRKSTISNRTVGLFIFLAVLFFFNIRKMCPGLSALTTKKMDIRCGQGIS